MVCPVFLERQIRVQYRDVCVLSYAQTRNRDPTDETTLLVSLVVPQLVYLQAKIDNKSKTPTFSFFIYKKKFDQR